MLVWAAGLFASCGGTGLPSTPVPPGVRLEAGSTTYEVEGATHRDILASLREHGPFRNGRRFFGYHEWSMRWRWRTRSGPLGCEITSVTVWLTSTITMPQWTAPPAADSSLRAEWVAYERALQIHELGHRRLALDAAGDVRRALLRVTAPTCGAIGTAARAVADPLLDALRRRQAQYDRDTRHGATQGASWTARRPVPNR